MRIGITGSWREQDREFWALTSNLSNFQSACRELGAAIAESGAAITVGSESEFTADKHVVEGYLSKFRENLSVRIIQPQTALTPFSSLYQQHPNSFVYLRSNTTEWKHTRQMLIADIDVLITVGGADGTYQAGLELKLTKKRLVPVGSFGGASTRLLAELLNTPTLRLRDHFEKLGNPWGPHLASHVVKSAGASEPSKVLLIHGHSHDRNELEAWLHHEKLADPIVMSQEFTSGQTLPEKFEFLAEEIDAAIALATPDDLASTAAQTDMKRLRARQNVWVEVGWFWGRLGRHRVLLLTRGEIEIPSDLDGIELFKYERSPLEHERAIRGFLESVGRRNQ